MEKILGIVCLSVLTASIAFGFGFGGGGGSNTPIATTSLAGKVKPDGSTITVQTDGTISAPSGGGGNVTGPGSSTSGYLPVWANSAGTLLGGGIKAGSTFTNTYICTYTTANGLQCALDPSTIGGVNGPGSTTSGYLATWNNTGGTLLGTGYAVGGNSGILQLNSSGQIPAVDAHLVTGLTASQLPNAASDATTKGVATFVANDFTDSSGLIGIDYTNGQAAATGAKGFLTSTDWNTFNGKLGSSLTSAYLFVGNGSNVATGVAMSGDVTIANTGATTIGSKKVVQGMINDNAVAAGQLATTITAGSTFLLDLSAASPATGLSYGLLLPAWANYVPSAGYPITYDHAAKAIKWYDAGWNSIAAVAAPVDATYLALGNDGTLTNERALTMGVGLAGTDAGAGSTYTINVDTTKVTSARTWSDGSTATVPWTFNVSTGTDPVITAGNNYINVSTGALQVGGAAVLTGNQSITLSGDVTGSGTTAITGTIANKAVTLAKMDDMATASLIYRKTAGTGAPEVNSLATLKTDLGLTGTNSGDQTITLTGDVTGSGTSSFAATIAAGSVTLAKQANMATSSLVYRKTAGSGAPEINTLATLKTDLGLTGTNSGDQTITLTGDVTGSGTGSFAGTIAAGAVTLAKMANMATASLIGRNTAATGVPEVLSASTARSLLGLGTVYQYNVGFAANNVPQMSATPGTCDSSTFLAGDGTCKAATGTIAGSTGSTDNAVLRANGTGGGTVQSSGCSVDDSGVMTCTSYASTVSDGLNKLAISNNTAISPTAASMEIYPEANVWKANQNGTEYSIPLSAAANQLTFGAVTSGGLLYGSASNTVASTGALTNHGIVVAQGAGSAPTVAVDVTHPTYALFANTSADPTYRAIASADLPVVAASKGGTGVANNDANTITFAGGNYSLTHTLAGNTNVTYPTSGTLAVLGANTFTGNQTLGSNSIVMTGSIGGTGAAKITKIWAVDGEFTNAPTVNGVAANASSGLILNPMTTAGDTIYGGTSGAATRLAKGAAFSFLRMNTGDTAPEWSTATIDDSTSNVTKLANGTSSLSVKAGQAVNFTGTFTDGKLCTFTSSGNAIGCNTDASGFTGGTLTSALTLKAGAVGAGAGPLYFQSGSNLTTAVAGAMEYDGTNFYLSPSTTRYSIPLAGATAPLTFTTGGSTARTITFPDAAITVARTDAANTFTGASSTTSWTETTPIITSGLTASGSGSNNFSASTGTFLTSTGAVTVGPGAVGITGIENHSYTARTSGVASYYTITPPTDTGQTASTESIGENHATATRTWATTGTVALQRERFFAGPTYASASASQTFTDAFNAYMTPPVAGTNAIITRNHTLGIVDSTSAASSITGGLVVATALGTAATSVGIGGGNVNAGGNGTFGGTLAVTGHTTLEGVTSTGATGTGKLVYDGTPTLVTPVIGAATGTSLVATGIVDGTVPVTITTATTGNLGATYASGYTINQYATAATAVTYTLPTAAAGKQYCIKNGYNGSAGNTGALRFSTSAAGQYIVYNGVLSAANGYIISAGALGDGACVVGIDATHWEFYPSVGTWTLH